MPHPLFATEIAPDQVEFLVTQEDDGGLVASATCASIVTQADAWEELEKMAREAVRCHYGDDAHPVIHLRMVPPPADA